MVHVHRIAGRVKWFNSKLGYGFITHKKHTNEEVDVFVHWSNLLLSDKDFHTLYKGEYVEFELESCICNENNVGVQACRVSGPNNSQLLTVTNTESNSYSHNTNSFSHAYSVRQLDIIEFTSHDNMSPKAFEFYFPKYPKRTRGTTTVSSSASVATTSLGRFEALSCA